MEDEEDGLSSLPDAILIEILSFLPIQSAATTSVLSHRWRHLWTGVSRVQLVVWKDDVKESPDIINRILRKLTSPKLHSFFLDVSCMLFVPRPSASVSWFRKVCSRNVEKIMFIAGFHDSDISFWIPSFLVNSQSLVTLKLYGLFEWHNFEDLHFNLPNLKILTLDHLDDIPLWFETLIKSSPLLENLNLVFHIDSYLDLSSSAVLIIAPNLKSLSINMNFYVNVSQRTRVSIDAPRLSNINIIDCHSIYYFLRNPTALVKARLNLKIKGRCEEEDNSLLHVTQEEYLWLMTDFIRRLSNVTNLILKLDWFWESANIFRHHSSVNLPIFSNLTRLKTECSMYFLLTLPCFPILEHLEVRLWPRHLQTLDDFPMEQSYRLLPDSIPDCLVSKLKTIQISGLQGTDDTLRLLAYILSNAQVLEKLCIDFNMVDTLDRHDLNDEREVAYEVWKECQFCRSLFKFPRSSSTCEVVVSGKSVTASGDALQDGCLTCQIVVDI